MARVLPVSEGPICEIWSGCLLHNPAQNWCSSGFGSWTHPFTSFISPIQFVTSQFNVDQQQYADDTQVFISLSKSNSPDRVSRLETALVHLTSWFYHNGLALNPEKSEAILLGTHPRNKSLDNITQVDVNGSPIPISDSIKLLGVTIDSSFAFNKHVSLICQSCQYHIRALRHIRPVLDATPPDWLDTLWWAPDLTTPTLSVWHVEVPDR